MPKLGMSAAAAEARRRAKVDPIELELNLEAPFLCVPAIPALALVALQEAIWGTTEAEAENVDTKRLQEIAGSVADLVRECIVPEERGRFDAGRAAQGDPDRAITNETLLELFRPLIEAYAAVPTVPAPPSSAGQEPTGSASVASQETPTLVELD